MTAEQTAGSSLLGSILPAEVAAEELFGDPPGLAPHPHEEHLIAKAVDKRRLEFISARYCARRAMVALGVEEAPILRGDAGAPAWPPGLVGSMTHTEGYRAAALGFTREIRSIGIDAEPHEPLPDGVLPAVSIERERQWLAHAHEEQGPGNERRVHWDKLLFCAKEATYKAWFPLTERWLGFEDAQITFARDPDAPDPSGSFRSELLVGGRTLAGDRLVAFDGRWAVRDGLVVAAIVVR